MLSEELQLDLARYVGAYIFDKVWNEPYMEYRRNIIPTLLYKHAQRGTADLMSGPIQLPTTNKHYFVYTVPQYLFGGICIDPNTWTSAEEYLSNNELLLRVHGTHGEFISRDGVYLRNCEIENQLVVAIEKNTLYGCTKFKYNPKDIYIAVYFDSDIVNPTNVYCKKLVTAQDANEMYALSQTDNAYTFVNGRECLLSSITDLNLGDYVEVVIDTNILGTFDIDLADDDQNRMFYSEEDSCQKQIIHIPKSMNHENKIYTENTCDVYARPRNDSDKHMNGLFIHRCQGRVNSFCQVTHNDFAIPMYILDDYKAFMDTDEITLHVVVRNHSKDNYLIRDKSYIDMLYMHNDDEILDLLEGTNPTEYDLSFWEAKALEQSVYVKTMYDTPENVHVGNMYDFVEALGYYHVLSLVCERVQKFTVTDTLSRTFEVDTPVIFGKTKMYTVVIINGVKISEDNYNLIRTNHGTVQIALDDTVEMNAGDSLIIEFFEKDFKTSVQATPVTGSETISINFKEYYLYEVQTNATSIRGFERSTTTVYHEITNIDSVLSDYVETEDGWDLTFLPGALDKTYIIQDKNLFYEHQYELVDMTLDNHPLVFNMEQDLLGDGIVTIPLLACTNTILYLNGRELVKNVDYELKHFQNWRGDRAFSQLWVYNMAYLKETDNIVEIIACRDELTQTTHGFTISEALNKIEDLPFFYDTLSTVTVDGYTARDVEIMGGKLIVEDSNIPARLGSLYSIRTIIPPSARAFIDTYHNDDDMARFLVLRAYFYTYDSPDPAIVHIPKSHHLYSIYLQTVLRDLIGGGLELGYDADPESMVLQIPQYDYILNMDKTLQDPPNLDFVDVFPAYQNLNNTVPNYTAFLQLVEGVRKPDAIQDGDTILVP